MFSRVMISSYQYLITIRSGTETIIIIGHHNAVVDIMKELTVLASGKYHCQTRWACNFQRNATIWVGRGIPNHPSSTSHQWALVRLPLYRTGRNKLRPKLHRVANYAKLDTRAKTIYRASHARSKQCSPHLRTFTPPCMIEATWSVRVTKSTERVERAMSLRSVVVVREEGERKL
ncbi:hypothetical protein BDR05DRAFT_757053 [Suillus weaverae]|nr:hypothetical protein BDR05DRAFT_757053 [Suillus weaverae]